MRLDEMNSSFLERPINPW